MRTRPLIPLAALLSYAAGMAAQTAGPVAEDTPESGTVAAETAAGTDALPSTLGQVAKRPNLIFYGDARLRYEDDFDSHTPVGVMRADRNRGRLRIRGGLDYQISDDWSVDFRLRSGSSRSQQSPHLTFASNDGVRDPVEVVADRYYIQFKQGGLSAWAGRNTTPFWQQNELFWDEDVTPSGLAAAYETRYGRHKFTATAGAFYVPDGGYRLNGQLFAGQFQYTLTRNQSQFTLAAGLHSLQGRTGAQYLLNRNGERDYLIGVDSAQWSFPAKHIPVVFGADLFHNFNQYSPGDVMPFPASNRDQKLGYNFSAQLGQLKKRQDWLLGLTYAYIERFAVNASYAQDDWVRFGTGAQTESSDFKGIEIRSGYAVSKKVNLLARLYLVQAITTLQDGKRFRLDLNWKF